MGSRRHRPEYGDRLKCGEHFIGIVSIRSSDNFFVLGDFRPGSDYEPYRHRFEMLADLLAQRDELVDRDVPEDELDRLSDRIDLAFDDLNTLELYLESPKTGECSRIRDFWITRQRSVEFKFEPQ